MHVPEAFLSSVLFIGAKEGGQFVPQGTGFLVRFPAPFYNFTYLVTAEHVITGLANRGDNIFVRVNQISGGAREFEIPFTQWYFHPDAERIPTDVAVARFPANQTDEARAIELFGDASIAATPQTMQRLSIGIGDETIAIGLFTIHHGRDRNNPIVRTGNLAAIPREPVATSYCGKIEAYLIEARSIAGLSGSPVFVMLPPSRIIKGEIENTSGNFAYLLGLVHGHFDVRNMVHDSVVEDARGSNGINTGVGIVVPVGKIIETIGQQDAQVERDKILKTFEALRQAGVEQPQSPLDHY